MRIDLRAALLLAAILPILRSTAWAQSSRGRVVLEVESCAQAESIRRIVSIELGDLLLASTAPAPQESERLAIRCSAEKVRMRASGDAYAQPIERTLRLDDFPGDAAPRAMALAGIEVLAALSPVVRERLNIRQSPPAALPAPALPPVAERRTASWSLGLAGSWRSFLVDQGPAVWGGSLAIGRGFGRHWLLAGDIEVAGTRKAVSLGRTSVLLSSVGVLAGVGTGNDTLAVDLGVGGRIGLGRLAGEATNDASVTSEHVLRPWGGPFARASLRATSGGWGVLVAVEAGRCLITAEGMEADLKGESSILAIRGSWVALSIGGVYRSRL